MAGALAAVRIAAHSVARSVGLTVGGSERSSECCRNAARTVPQASVEAACATARTAVGVKVSEDAFI
ncbi:MAG: hypothetical protein ACXWC9_09170 [Pseudobdellovibrionaceae bacterium]